MSEKENFSNKEVKEWWDNLESRQIVKLHHLIIQIEYAIQFGISFDFSNKLLLIDLPFLSIGIF